MKLTSLLKYSLKAYRPSIIFSPRSISSSVRCLCTSNRKEWDSVVGLEIHAQINAKSKLFSGSGTEFRAPTNSQTSYFDAALPGTLPVCNKYCIEAGILTALALNCKIHKTSSFDRKHYFYYDLPAGYQITQQFHPLATDGYIEFTAYSRELGIEPYNCKVRLKQLQIEQDSGRSFHLEQKKTLVDLNRAGIGLMEIVFEPDIKNGFEAYCLLKELQLILTTLGTCTCIMQEGALRIDANISINRPGEPWGVRTEVKNINSFRYITKAIDFEINRQIELLESGQLVRNETRSFDSKTSETVFMRDKEEFQDYRFFPEPNLPPIQLCEDTDEKHDIPYALNIDDLRRQMPQLPSDLRHFLMNTYHLSIYDADRVIKTEGLLEYFKSIAIPGSDQGHVVAFLSGLVQHQLNQRQQTFKKCEVTPSQLKGVLDLLTENVITPATATDILEMIFNGDGRSAKEIVEKYNWSLISDEKTLIPLCEEAIKQRRKMAKKYKNTRRWKYMIPLLNYLNYKVNNRASIEAATAVFTKLLIGDSESKPQDEKCD